MTFGYIYNTFCYVVESSQLPPNILIKIHEFLSYYREFYIKQYSQTKMKQQTLCKIGNKNAELMFIDEYIHSYFILRFINEEPIQKQLQQHQQHLLLLQQAYRFQKRYQYEEAIQQLKKALIKNPFQSSTYKSLANISQLLNQTEDSLFYYKKAYEINKFRMNFLKDLQECENILPKEATSNIYQQKRLTIKQTSVDILNILGYHHFILNNPEEAISYYRQALKINPFKAEVYCNLGYALEEIDKEGKVLDKISSCYQKAIDLKPERLEFYNNFGNFLIKNQHSQALTYLDKALQIGQDTHFVYNNIGIHFSKKSQYQQAIFNYQKALNISPSEQIVHFNLGNAFFKIGQIAKAINHYQKALYICPKNYKTLINLGCSYLKKGQVLKAQSSFERARNLKFNGFQALNNIGCCYLRQNKIKHALSCFREAAEISKEAIQIQNNIQIWCKEQAVRKIAKSDTDQTILQVNNQEYKNNQYSIISRISALDQSISINSIESGLEIAFQKNISNQLPQIQPQSEDDFRSFLDSIRYQSPSDGTSNVQLYTDRYFERTEELKNVKILMVLDHKLYTRAFLDQIGQLAFQNYMYLIKYLALNKPQLKFIVQYYYDQDKQVKRKIDQNSYYQSFRLIMTQGLSSFIMPRGLQTNPNYVMLLWQEGFQEVLTWIRCCVEGIQELQQHGIFHADLQFRNTIRVRNKDQLQTPQTYKIIDFDYAFKVELAKGQKQNKSYEVTKQLFIKWLQSPTPQQKKRQIINFIFRNIKDHKSDKAVQQICQEINSIQQSNDEPLNKVQRMMKELRFYMLFYHKQQVKQVIQEIFQSQNKYKILGQSLVQKIARIPTISFSENMKGYQNIIDYLQRIDLQAFQNCTNDTYLITINPRRQGKDCKHVSG